MLTLLASRSNGFMIRCSIMFDEFCLCISWPLALCLAPRPCPGPRLRAPTLAPNLHFPALAPNLYIPALVPNLGLPALAPNLGLPALAPNLYLPALVTNLYLYPGQDFTTITTATCTITTTTATTANNNTYNKRCLRGSKIRIKWPLKCI